MNPLFIMIAHLLPYWEQKFTKNSRCSDNDVVKRPWHYPKLQFPCNYLSLPRIQQLLHNYNCQIYNRLTRSLFNSFFAAFQCDKVNYSVVTYEELF